MIREDLTKIVLDPRQIETSSLLPPSPPPPPPPPPPLSADGG